MDTTCNIRIKLVIILLSFRLTANGQNVRITAPDRFILKTERIQIYCQPAGSLYAQINAVAILKNNQPMVNVGNLNGQSTIVWQDSSVQSRATINTPDLSAVSSSQLRITIDATNTQCNDEAVYTCIVNGLDSSFNTVQNNEVSHNVTVVVKPDRMNDMQISPLPSTAGQYLEGENITLSCTGTVGSYIDPPQITWSIQRSGDFNPTDLESDNFFRSISQSNPQSVGPGPTTGCQFERTSTVVYQVANTDSHTIFFCQITAPGDSGICGQGTVRQQKSIKVAHTTQTTGSGITKAETSQVPGSGSTGAETSQVPGSGSTGAETSQVPGSGSTGDQSTQSNRIRITGGGDNLIISINRTPEVVTEFQSVKRSCSAFGNPTPTVNWYRDNVPYTYNTGTYAISDTNQHWNMYM